MSLQVWLPLNGSLENKGLSDLKFQIVNYNNAITSAASGGKIVPGLYKRTTKETADYIISNKSITLSGDVTMCCWAKVTGVGYAGSANGIFGQHGHLTGGLGITMKDVSSTDLRMSVNTGLYGDSGASDRTFCTYYGSTNIYNAWHHLCLTYNSSTKQLRMYVDGNLETITGYGNYITLAGNSTVARPIILFAWSTDHLGGYIPHYRPPCELNDVRVYDHCLSPREVKLLAQGLVAHYKLESTAPNLLINANKYTSSSPLIRTNSSTDGYELTDMYCQVVPGRTYYFSCKTDGQWYQHNTSGVSPSNKYATVWFYLTYNYNPDATAWDGDVSIGTKCFTKTEGEGVWSFTIPAGYNGLKVRTNTYSDGTNPVTIKFWDFHLSDSTFITQRYDCSGYGNHGTCSASFKYDYNSPRYKNCANFSDNKHISIPSRSYDGMKNSYTFSYWAKINEIHGKMTFGFTNGNRLNVFPWSNESNPDAAPAKSWFNWNTNDSAQNPFKKNGTNVLISPYNGAWHHYTITGNGSASILYIDGEYAGTALNYRAITGTQIILSGYDTSANYKWNNGQISDFRIYATALSAAAVKELYQSSISFLDNGTLQTSEIIEASTDLKFKENGITQANNISESIRLNEIATKTLSDGSLWGRVFYHNNVNGTVLFTSAAEVLHTTQTNKFSRLDWLPYFKGNHEKYEFLLTYPSLVDGTNLSTQYNRWRQNKAPQEEWLGDGDGSLNATGYEEISISWRDYNWGGLVRQNANANSITSCYIDGSTNHGNWYYAIGASSAWGGGVPGPHGSIGVSATELWVRLDTNIKMFNNAIQTTQIYEL